MAMRIAQSMIPKLTAMVQQCYDHVVRAVIVLVTLPYYRFFHLHTLGVIRRVARYCSRPEDIELLLRLLTRWRNRKLAELQYISIACAILLGAVIETFSWSRVDEAYWLTLIFWYTSLVLAILGILLSAQQVAVLNFLGSLPPDHEKQGAQEEMERLLLLLVTPETDSRACSTPSAIGLLGQRCRPSRRMVFTWQCPIMFMSYSVCFYLLGVTVFVITPLFQVAENGWSGNVTVAVIYLGMISVVGPTFLFCAFWTYHFVDLESEAVLDTLILSRPQTWDQPKPFMILPHHTDASSLGPIPDRR